MKSLKRMKYRDMAILIEAISEEIQRRNPIGVNMYTPHISQSAELILEISKGEVGNFTSECGPRE